MVSSLTAKNLPCFVNEYIYSTYIGALQEESVKQSHATDKQRGLMMYTTDIAHPATETTCKPSRLNSQYLQRKLPVRSVHSVQR